MNGKKSAEYKTAIKLYKQGKITAEERDRIIEALNESDDELELENAEDGVSYGECTPQDEEEAEKSIGEKLKELGIKIGSQVKSGLKKAGDAMKKAGVSIRKAIKNTAQKIADKLSDEDEKEEFEQENIPEEKRVYEEYDIDYEKLIIRVNYVNGEKAVSLAAKGSRAEALKRKCCKVMSDSAYDCLCAVIDERFTGKYEFNYNEELLLLTVRPKK